MLISLSNLANEQEDVKTESEQEGSLLEFHFIITQACIPYSTHTTLKFIIVALYCVKVETSNLVSQLNLLTLLSLSF